MNNKGSGPPSAIVVVPGEFRAKKCQAIFSENRRRFFLLDSTAIWTKNRRRASYLLIAIFIDKINKTRSLHSAFPNINLFLKICRDICKIVQRILLYKWPMGNLRRQKSQALSPATTKIPEGGPER